MQVFRNGIIFCGGFIVHNKQHKHNKSENKVLHWTSIKIITVTPHESIGIITKIEFKIKFKLFSSWLLFPMLHYNRFITQPWLFMFSEVFVSLLAGSEMWLDDEGWQWLRIKTIVKSKRNNENNENENKHTEHSSASLCSVFLWKTIYNI